MNKWFFFIFILFSLMFAQRTTELSQEATATTFEIMPEMLASLQKTNDPWFSEDKFYHLTASALIPVFSYHVYNHLTDADENKVKLYSLSATAFIGIGKEIYDKKKKNHFSWKDLFWDGVGIVIGYIVFTN